MADHDVSDMITWVNHVFERKGEKMIWAKERESWLAFGRLWHLNAFASWMIASHKNHLELVRDAVYTSL
jgi:hypothetical protein